MSGSSSLDALDEALGIAGGDRPASNNPPPAQATPPASPAVAAAAVGSAPAEPAAGFPGFDALPAEKRASILAAAIKFGIRQDDPLFQIIVALEWHLALYQEIPGNVREAGHQAAELVNLTREGFRVDGEDAQAKIRDVLADFLKSAKPSLQTAATAGVQDGLKRLDTKALIAEIAGQVSEKAAKSQAKRWFTLALLFAGVVSLAGLAAGFFTGRHVFPVKDAYAEKAALYMRQMQCGTEGWKIAPGQIVCRNPANGTAVTLQIPNE